MGSFAEFDVFAHLSRLGDFTKKESKTFGFPLTIEMLFNKSDTEILKTFQGGLLYPLSQSLMLIFTRSYFRKSLTIEIDEKGSVPILFDTITDTKESPLYFFRASPRIAAMLRNIFAK